MSEKKLTELNKKQKLENRINERSKIVKNKKDRPWW